MVISQSYPQKLEIKELQAAGHFYRHQEEAASKFILWEPKHGTSGTRSKTFLQTLLEDTGVKCVSELVTLMEDKNDWKFRCQAIIQPAVTTTHDDDGRLRSN